VFPNPTTGTATVRFDLVRASDVEVDLYDVRGALMRKIASGWRAPGSYTETWDGHDRGGRRLPKGVYLLRFTAGAHRETRKVIVRE
jgi:flagellar hook assembly protein FlgD